RVRSDACQRARHVRQCGQDARRCRQAHGARFLAGRGAGRDAPGDKPHGPKPPRARRLSRASSRGAPARQARGAKAMKRQIGGPVVVLALVALAATACGRTAMARFYTLDSVATPDPGPRASYGVVVGPVTGPSSVRRPEFVVQVTPHRVAVDEFNRWAGPLDESIARVVAGDLTTQLGTPRVAAAPAANFDAAYRVTINVQRFDSIPGREVV